MTSSEVVKTSPDRAGEKEDAKQQKTADELPHTESSVVSNGSPSSPIREAPHRIFIEGCGANFDPSPRKLATFQRLQTFKGRSSSATITDGAMQSSSSFLSIVSFASVAPPVHQRGLFGPRVPTLMTPSPAGAVLETLEVAAGFDCRTVLKSIPTMRIDAEAPPSSPLPGKKRSGASVVLDQFRLLFRSQIYIWTVFTLCALLFVVTGIQYWSTKFFVARGAYESKLQT